MSQPLVSVIIPNYNSIGFIEETLESVFGQTYPNLEIIVVDDGSTDGSFQCIEKSNQPNLKLVKNPSKGACAARNHGLRLAQGEYIQFLDADDLLSKDKIAEQVALLEQYPNNVAVCSTKHFYSTVGEGVITDTPFLYTTDNPKAFLLNLYGADAKNHNMVAQHAWLTPKKIIDKVGFWDETLVKDQDGEFFCRVVVASQGICLSENVLCFYRKHRQSGNVSSGKSRNHLLSQLQSLHSKSKQLETEKNTIAYKNAMALQYKIIAINAYPEFKDLSEQALTISNTLGGSSYEPVLGGKIIELVKCILGWKAAKTLWYWVH